MAKKKYYAVKVGMTPGIYETWSECEANVKNYPGTEYKGFGTYSEAQAYLCADDTDCKNVSDKQSIQKGSSEKISTEYIGQDEVGKGEPFRVPVVVATYLDGRHMEELKKTGALRDSKKYGLDTDKCVKMGKELTCFKTFSECKNGVYENDSLGIVYSIYSIDNHYYNELHSQDNKMNANKILAIMHNRVGFNLANHLAKKGIVIKDVVIDNFLGVNCAGNNFSKYVAREKYRLDISGVNIHYETKAEGKYPAVAVSSNIANYIEQLYVEKVRRSIKEKGGDLDGHGFSNGVEDVQYAFDEIVKVYGSLDSPKIEEHFKHTVYYENYIKTGSVH